MAARLTLKNSSVQFRNATGEQLGFGEIALNYHESGPYLQCKDSSGAIIQIGGTYVSTIAPLNPIKGKQWLNTSNDTLYIYSGTAWVGVFVVNVDGDLPEGFSMTTADLNLDEPSPRGLPDSTGLATQKDLNIWIGDSLDGLDGRIKEVEQDYTTSEEFTDIALQVSQNKKDIKALQEAPGGDGGEINLDAYATKADLTTATGALPYRLETDKVLRDADLPAKQNAFDDHVGETHTGGEIQLVDNLGFFHNVRFTGRHGIETSSDQQGIIVDGSELNDRIAALEAQVELLASLVPPVDYGTVSIQGGNDYANGQCWLSPNETGVFICSLDGTQTTGCRYSWELMRGEGRFSGSTADSTVAFICQTAAPGTVVLRCTVSHPTTEETAHGEITILVQPAD